MIDPFARPQFDYMGKRRLAIAFSLVMIVVSLVAIVGRGMNFGVDFTGGYTIELGYPAAVDPDDVRARLAEAGIDGAQVQTVGSASDVLLRLAPRDGADAASLSDDVLAVLQESGAPPIEVRQVEFVGPQVGQELREKGGFAVLVALVSIAAYITMRYEKKFALGAVLATVHDVVVTVGFFALFGWAFDLTVLAAILAIIGYSLNDTIVVFDRIRTGFRESRGEVDSAAIINEAINSTLSRTLITSGTTLMVVLSLLFLGGPVIHGFALALVIGIGYGTYSSIFVASLLVHALGVSRVDLVPTLADDTAPDPVVRGAGAQQRSGSTSSGDRRIGFS